MLRTKRYLLLIIFLMITFQTSCAYAYVDLGISYAYSKRRVVGEDIVNSDEDPGEAITTTTTKAINWAWYIWEYTALELNYSESTQELVDNRETTTSDSSITIKKIDSTVVTTVEGAGIRQSLAPRKSTFIPSVSIGYAKMTVSGKTNYLLGLTGAADQTLSLIRDKETFNSSYATFQLKIRITKLMGLTFAAKTVMPDFETSEADKNLTYTAGFSWVF